MKQTIRNVSFIECFFIILCTLYFIIPEAQKLFPFYYIIVVETLYSIYLIITNCINKRVFARMLFLVIVVALMYTFLTEARSISDDVALFGLKRFISKFVQYSCMFFPLLLLKRCVTACTKVQNYVIIVVSLLAMLVSCKAILNLIAINPLAARDFGFSASDVELVDFIAPYPFVYGMSFVFVATFFFLKFASKNDNNLFRIIVIFLFLFFFYFLLKSQFTLSLLTSIISILVVLLHHLKYPATKFVFSLFVFVIFIFVPYILEYLVIPYLPSMLALRFREIQEFFLGTGSVDSDLSGRLTLYGKTIMAFIDSPLIGNRYLDFDGHATYLTIWADLGFFGGAIIIYLIISAKRIVESYLDVLSVCFFPFFIHLILNGLTNPIHASLQIYICVWFLIPLSLVTFKDKLKIWNLQR